MKTIWSKRKRVGVETGTLVGIGIQCVIIPILFKYKTHGSSDLLSTPMKTNRRVPQTDPQIPTRHHILHNSTVKIRYCPNIMDPQTAHQAPDTSLSASTNFSDTVWIYYSNIILLGFLILIHEILVFEFV
ncbi:hypothetical protein RYX36_010920 [Vicia faba]